MATFKMRSTLSSIFTVLAMSVYLVACAQVPIQPNAAASQEKPAEVVLAQSSASAAATAPVLTRCPEKRSEICPSIHKPVCAQRDTGIRCVRAPCPSEAPVTFENSCAACRDSKVIGYVEGACSGPDAKVSK